MENQIFLNYFEIISMHAVGIILNSKGDAWTVDKENDGLALVEVLDQDLLDI